MDADGLHASCVLCVHETVPQSVESIFHVGTLLCFLMGLLLLLFAERRLQSTAHTRSHKVREEAGPEARQVMHHRELMSSTVWILHRSARHDFV